MRFYQNTFVKLKEIESKSLMKIYKTVGFEELEIHTNRLYFKMTFLFSKIFLIFYKILLLFIFSTKMRLVETIGVSLYFSKFSKFIILKANISIIHIEVLDKH